MQRLIVGIFGASGITNAVRTLELVRLLDVETHLIVSQGGDRTRAKETELSAEQVRSLADVSYNFRDIGATIASGSFRTDGMIVAPIDEIVHHTVARMLDLFGLDAALARWGEGTRDANIEQQSSETKA
jgi:3-polyprenyl-4-hydroxybenzoate decarboxylase